MEENERPSKLRKLSHGTDQAIIKDVAGHHAQDGTHPMNERDAELRNSNASTLDELLHSESVDDDAADSANWTLKTKRVEEVQVLLSKNQLKKLKKKEAWEAGRDERKLKRKEKDREKKARKRVAIQEAIADGREHDVAKIQHPDRRPRPIRRTRLPVAFMLDCGFDEYMLERESISLGTQITRSYSEYMKSPYQPHLVVSGWTKENVNRKRFEGLLRGMYKNWSGVVFTEEDFVGASLIVENNMRGWKGGRMVAAFEKHAPPKSDYQQPGQQNDTVQEVEKSGPDVAPNENLGLNSNSANTGSPDQAVQAQHQTHLNGAASEHLKALQDHGEIIYLTSDSPNTLTELKPYHTYIIGGIVDKNRHKGLCYKRALDANSNQATKERLQGRQVKTAKLPIGEYMQMASRQVLATNHVVEIMLRWLECRDWGQAFSEIMPKRKGAKLREESPDGVADGPEENDQDDDLETHQTDNETELAAHASLNRENGDLCEVAGDAVDSLGS